MSLLTVILPFFILILLGYLAKAAKILRLDDAEIINKTIIYLFLPALIFQAVRKADFTARLLFIPLISLLTTAGCVVLAYLFARRLGLKRTLMGALLLAVGVGNTGYLGYPLTIRLFGQEQLVKAIFYDIFGTVAFLFTAGLVIAESYGSGRTGKARTILTFPPLIALTLGWLWHYLTLPPVAADVIGLLAAATIPLMMVSIGLSLQPAKVENYLMPLLLILIIKLVIAPLIALSIGGVLPADSQTLSIVVLEASMPVAVLSLIIGLKYKLETEFIAAAIFLTTILSMITIPVWRQIAALLGV